jgi:tRNA A37 threonylcarbamoyladenosine dehydratase
VGLFKTEVAEKRLRDINPEIKINTFNIFYSPETDFDFSVYDYIVDAIDSVTGKIALAVNAEKAGVPIISSMGAGNKLDPTLFEISDIYKTSVCPLARVMRRELKQRGVKKLKVVYSKEPPLTPLESEEETAKRQVPGSIAFVPSVVGLIIGGEVVKDLSNI